MNTNLLKYYLEESNPADQANFLDYLIYLTWSERPFRETVDFCLEVDRLHSQPPWRQAGWLTDLFYCRCILRGAWTDIRRFGLTEAWPRIAGLYR